MDARVAVLASGGGTNLQALLDDPVVGPWIKVVIADRADAGALERARGAAVQAVFVDPAVYAAREAMDAAVLAILQEQQVEVIVMAGYMRVVSPVLIDAFPGKILNVHPSLLPAFPGGTSVADALAWGARVTGVTVHLVDEEVDHGPIVAQEAMVVEPDDDLHSLESRVHAVEHRLLPAAVRALVEGRLTVDGRAVRIEEAT